jgi:hypothetical protein
MKLGRFMDDAYRGLNKGRSLRSEKGDPIFSLDDLQRGWGPSPAGRRWKSFCPRILAP